MQNYRIADLIVRMDCKGRTAKQAEVYKTDNTLTPDVTISISQKEIDFARTYNPLLPDDEWEYILSATAFYRALVRHNGFMLHASAVLYQDRAFLFSAPSGTGKSTHTNLWRKRFGEENVRILNDDKPAIRRVGDSFFAYGTPWSGKHDISIPVGVPLAGICFLERSDENKIVRLSSREALSNLFSQTLRKLPDEDLDLLFEQLSLLLCETPIYRLSCNISEEAAELAERVMNRKDTTPTFTPAEGRTPYTVREGYSLRTKAGSNVIACRDDERFIGLTTLNSTGVFLFRILEKGATQEELVTALRTEYEIPQETASTDVSRFLERLLDLDIIQK